MQRFGYVDTTRGQVHFREAGTGPAVVLLHWGPGTSAQYSASVDELAVRGYRAIAPDLPGFGNSMRREGHWSIADFANNVAECLDGWQLERCALLGGHLASLIAMEVAQRVPRRLAMVALDGSPVWDDARRREILKMATPSAMVLREDGEHLKELWKHLLWEVRMWRPNAPYDEALGAFAMKLVKAKIAADFDLRPMRALLEYDVFGALAALATTGVPVLALSATDDPLYNCHEAVLQRVPAATGHVFPGEHPVHAREHAATFVAPLVARYRAILGAG